MIRSISQAVKNFHHDEQGQTIEMVMLIALGAMVMVGLHSIWKGNIVGSVTEKISGMFSLDFKKEIPGVGK